MANTSLILTSLDFDTIRNTFKQYLRAQDRFNDYDFDGSNISVLLDLLAYNTFTNSFYLNMVGNEMFLDSAQMRDSVVSHAKELNYTPRSFKSAEALVDITIVSTDMTKRSVVIPKGTTFTSNFGSKSYTFSTGENIIVDDFTIGSSTVIFNKTGITLFEGYYVTDTYASLSQITQRYIINNKNIDTSSLNVTVIEDGGATILTYNRATSLFDLNSTSKVFFVQGAENDSYEITFGDGVTGRKPKNASTVVIEYRISNGELPNGCSQFTSDSTIDGESNITVSAVSNAAGGTVSETIESIKYNATRHFNTQERAITTEDYETLMRLNFTEVNAVSAYGGEDMTPPQYGKVFVAVDLNDIDYLPESKKDIYYKFIKARSPVSIDPVFVEPDYIYIQATSDINYNINITRLTAIDISTIVSSAIISFANANLNGFNKSFRYSRLLQAIDNCQISMVSNQTEIKLYKKIVVTNGSSQKHIIDFKLPLDLSLNKTDGNYTVYSTHFVYAGNDVYFRDDGRGNINIASYLDDRVIKPIGKVNYDTGLIQIEELVIDDMNGPAIKLYVDPVSKDITTNNNVILNILHEDIKLNVHQVKQ
jgi:hypothetical protein